MKNGLKKIVKGVLDPIGVAVVVMFLSLCVANAVIADV